MVGRKITLIVQPSPRAGCWSLRNDADPMNSRQERSFTAIRSRSGTCTGWGGRLGLFIARLFGGDEPGLVERAPAIHRPRDIAGGVPGIGVRTRPSARGAEKTRGSVSSAREQTAPLAFRGCIHSFVASGLTTIGSTSEAKTSPRLPRFSLGCSSSGTTDGGIYLSRGPPTHPGGPCFQQWGKEESSVGRPTSWGSGYRSCPGPLLEGRVG